MSPFFVFQRVALPRRCVLAVVLVVACMLIAASAQAQVTFEEVLDQQAALVNEAADALGKVRTPADAQAAAPTVADVAARLSALTRRVRQNPPAGVPDAERLKPAVERVRAATQRVQREVERFRATPGLAQPLHTAMFDLTFALTAASDAFNRPSPEVDWQERERRMEQDRLEQQRLDAQMQADVNQLLDNAEQRAVVTLHGLTSKHNVATQRVKHLAGARAMRGQGSGTTMTVTVAPVADVQALADAIDFGQVRSVDPVTRTIVVDVDVARLPEAAPRRSTTPAAAVNPAATTAPQAHALPAPPSPGALDLANLKPGDAVEIDFAGRPTPVTVVEVEADRVLLHLDGYHEVHKHWFPKDRVRLRNALTEPP